MGSKKSGIHFQKDFEGLFTHIFSIQTKGFQDMGPNPFLLAKKSKKDMRGTEHRMVAGAGFFPGVLKGLFQLGCNRKVAGRFRDGRSNVLNFNLSEFFREQAILQNLAGHADFNPAQAKKKMVRAHVIMLKSTRKNARQFQGAAGIVGKRTGLVCQFI
jgi:hypothetical protein